MPNEPGDPKIDSSNKVRVANVVRPDVIEWEEGLLLADERATNGSIHAGEALAELVNAVLCVE